VDSDQAERLGLWRGLMGLLASNGDAKRFGVRNDEGSSAFVGADRPANHRRLSESTKGFQRWLEKTACMGIIQHSLWCVALDASTVHS
jgi:hypothetical protein